ncbi:MAG: hypothetical protein ACR2NU_03845 [Aeoliella sp.]
MNMQLAVFRLNGLIRGGTCQIRLGLLMVAVSSCFGANARAILIDDFSDGEVALSRMTGEGAISDTQSGLDVNTIVGGNRAINPRARDYISGSVGSVMSRVDTGENQLVYTTDPG